jgi:hypothetical protein
VPQELSDRLEAAAYWLRLSESDLIREGIALRLEQLEAQPLPYIDPTTLTAKTKPAGSHFPPPPFRQ